MALLPSRGRWRCRNRLGFREQGRGGWAEACQDVESWPDFHAGDLRAAPVSGLTLAVAARRPHATIGQQTAAAALPELLEGNLESL